jgi:hypothetical protein
MSAADYSRYDRLLKQAKGSARYWIPRLCEALKRENSEMSSDDIRERVKKDCIGIWQRDTITDALPEEYKDKLRSVLGKKGRQKQLEQADGTLTTEIVPETSRAKHDSFSSTEQQSQTFVTPKSDSEMINSLRNQLEEVKEENKRLKEEHQIELLPELQSHLYYKPEVLNEKELQKIDEDASKNLELVLQRYMNIIRSVTEAGRPVPIRLYVITSEHKLVPIKLRVDFRERKVELSLWKTRLKLT